MSKTRLLTILVIGLMLLNLGIIGFMVLNKPPHLGERRGRPGKLIVERLNFDKKQTAQFNTLLRTHRSKTKAVLNEMRDSKNQLFALLKSEDQSKKDSLINIIGSLQKELEVLHFQHFTDIKAICKPEQINDYNQFVSEMGNFIPPGHPPKRRR